MTLGCNVGLLEVMEGTIPGAATTKGAWGSTSEVAVIMVGTGETVDRGTRGIDLG